MVQILIVVEIKLLSCVLVKIPMPRRYPKADATVLTTIRIAKSLSDSGLTSLTSNCPAGTNHGSPIPVVFCIASQKFYFLRVSS